MAQLVIHVEVTISDDADATARIDKVQDSNGADITDRFIHYCEDNQLPLDSQAEVEKAASDFSSANNDWLP